MKPHPVPGRHCCSSSYRLRLFILLALLLLAHAPAYAGTVSVVYEPSGPEHASVVALLTENRIGEDVARVINDLGILPADVIIHFGTEEGPQYAPPVSGPAEIHFPYDFVHELRRLFSRNGYAEGRESLDRATLDVVQHTLFHELGHAIIAMRHMDTEGGEEDAVDSLATILLIESYENGGDIALSAADAFSYLASEEDSTEQPPHHNATAHKRVVHNSARLTAALDEHSMNENRYETIACLVYGSAPERYEFLARDLGLSAQDAENCTETYAKQSEYWFTQFQN